MTDRHTTDTDIVSEGAKTRPEMASSKRKQGPATHSSRASNDRNNSAVDYEALAQFRYELRKFQAFSKAAAYKAGLTPQQHQALLTIRGFSSSDLVSVGDIAEFLLIRHHTAVELMDRMTGLGLLSRSVDEADGRRVLVKLTKEGKRRLRKLSRIHLEELRAIGPTLAKMLKPFRSA
jgi:DNA-binding MarR family transcriptional regulator